MTMALVKCITGPCSKYPKTACFLVAAFVAAMIVAQMKSNEMKTTVRRLNFSSEFPYPVPTYSAESGKWHNFSSDMFRLYAYRAFLDDRPSLLSLPVIRIMAVSDLKETMPNNHEIKFRCIVYYKTNAVVASMEHQPLRIGLGLPMNGIMAREHMYTCPIVKGEIPLSVSISTERNESLSPGIPVIIPNKPETKREFCVCVQAVYGTLDPYRIIEWMEFQRILGVSLVGVYVLSAPDVVLKVFRHYADEGFVDLHKIDYIYSNKTGDKEFWLHLTPTINDCIYRHMYEFKRIIVIDFDEFIMPRKHGNLSELVSYLDKSNGQAVNFGFSNNYFFLDLAADEAVSKYLTFLKYRKRVAVSEVGYSMKSIINPLSCISMHNHFCWTLTEYYTKFSDVTFVHPSVALNQHYKKCHLNAAECRDLMNVTFDDDSMLRFKEILTERVTKKVEDIMGHGMYPDRQSAPSG